MIKLYKTLKVDIIVNSIMILCVLGTLLMPFIYYITFNYQMTHKEQNVNISIPNNVDQSRMIDFAIEYYTS